jgi:hypothetical protein
MNKINWNGIVVFAIVALLVFLIAGSLLEGWRHGGWGMMGPGMMQGWGFAPSAGSGCSAADGSASLWLVWTSKRNNPPAPTKPVHSAGVVQADGATVYCGTTLTSS